MIDKMTVIEKITAVFQANEYPGDPFLLGSWEGSEPFEEVGPFQGKKKWQKISFSFLDMHASALSFFSEAGFRFYLPAYLVADLKGRLDVADPLFHLTHGFSEEQIEHTIQDRAFTVRTGKTVLINPRRYGAMTSYDYARYRLSVFTREESGAIVEYLKYQREHADLERVKTFIEAALDLFWLDRAKNAPTDEELKRHLQEQKEYLDAVRRQLKRD